MPFIDISSPKWIPYLETGLHDLYHLPEYVALDAQWMKGEPLGWIYNNDDCHCLIPLIRRSINNVIPEIHPLNGPLYDLISPYGYPGILSFKPLTAEEASRAMNLFLTEASTAGYISSFIRLNPFFNNWLLPVQPEFQHLPARSGFRQCLHGVTLSIDLTNMQSKTYEHLDTSSYPCIPGHLPDDFSLNHRRNLCHLHREGYAASTNSWNLLSDFSAAYTATMIRRKAAPRYLLQEDYFSRLKIIAGGHLIFITVSSPEGEFCCGGLFSLFGRTMQYLFGATIISAMHHSPSKLMMEKAINEGVNHGAEVLHLGGGVGAGITDGVFRFKQGFAHNRHDFHCMHFIHRPEIYNLLENCLGSSNTCLNHVQTQVLNENTPMPYAAEESLTYGENPRFFPSYRSNDK